MNKTGFYVFFVSVLLRTASSTSLSTAEEFIVNGLITFSDLAYFIYHIRIPSTVVCKINHWHRPFASYLSLCFHHHLRSFVLVRSGCVRRRPRAHRHTTLGTRFDKCLRVAYHLSLLQIVIVGYTTLTGFATIHTNRLLLSLLH